LEKRIVQNEDLIAQTLLTFRQSLDWLWDEQHNETPKIQATDQITMKIEKLKNLNYRQPEIEELLQTEKRLTNTVADIKLLEDEILKICEKDGKVLKLDMSCDRTQEIFEDQNLYPEVNRDLNGEVIHVVKEFRQSKKNIVNIYAQGLEAAVKTSWYDLRNYEANVQKLESKVEKLVNLIISKIAPYTDCTELSSSDGTGKVSKKKKKVHVIDMVQNMNVLMAGSNQNNEEIAMFLSSLSNWLNKQTNRGVEIFKSHSEIKVLWKMLRDKRNGSEEEISKLIKMYEQLRQTVNTATARSTENGAMISSFYSQHKLLADEFKELSCKVSHMHKKELRFVEELTSCSKLYFLLRNGIPELEKEMSKLLKLGHFARKDLYTLNPDLWISQEVAIKQESKFISAHEVKE